MEFGEGIKSVSYTILVKQTEVESTQRNVAMIMK